MQSAYADFTPDDEPETVDDELATRLNERLARLPLPYLTSTEQFDLADLVECAATAEKHRRSMDDNAMRYLLFFRQHMIRKSQAPERQVGITWREIAWAFQSGSQDILVDLVSKSFKGRMVWEQARESGVFMWMTDISAVVRIGMSPVNEDANLGPRELNSKSLQGTSTPRRTRRTRSTAASTTWL